MALNDYNNGKIYTFKDAKSTTSGEWFVPIKELWTAFGG